MIGQLEPAVLDHHLLFIPWEQGTDGEALLRWLNIEEFRPGPARSGDPVEVGF